MNYRLTIWYNMLASTYLCLPNHKKIVGRFREADIQLTTHGSVSSHP
jgi:hypothetical protein